MFESSTEPDPRRRVLASGSVVLIAALVVMVATTAASDESFQCPVTIPPQPGFVPSDPDTAEPSIDDAVWYGDADLWTLLSSEGSYQPRKSVWWSEKFPGGKAEPTPDIAVSWERLDADRPEITVDEGTNAFTGGDGWFMIAGIDPNEAGCWRVTARYKGATLSYMYERPATES